MAELVEIPAVEQDLHCPLCEYNLRGLTEPRCPECGAAFDWDEVRDPSRRLHPYLFEHHPERDVSSFLQTLRGGLNPRRFWTTLFPTQPSRPRRLMWYWLICIGVGMLASAVQFGVAANWLQIDHQSERARVAGMAAKGWVPPPGMTLQQVQDLWYPLFPSPSFFMELLGFSRRAGWAYSTHEIWWVGCYFQFMLLVIWPAVAVAVMMLLRATMRRAQVRRIHLARVAIYCCDLAAWSGLISLPLVVLPPLAGPHGAPPSDWSILVMWLPVIAFFVMTHRLALAIANYLRVRHAFGTALAVQVIFVLVAMKMLMMMLGY